MRVTFFVLLFASVTLLASAQGPNITFPVAELGNCSSKSECHTYCDDLRNINKCVAFGESHGLMSAEQATKARMFAKIGGEGPGGCTSKDSCETYCEEASNMRQCLQFAKKSGVMSGVELAEAEKVLSYMESGGTMPGGCRGERECRAYCEAGEHMEECAAFAIKAGFMSEKEVEIFRKTGGKGPGGCSGKQCEVFCKDESNREQCIAFALEHNLMSQEDKERMKDGMKKAQEALQKAPPEVLACITNALGDDAVVKAQRGEGIISPRFGEVLPTCFKQVMGDGSRGPFGPGSAAVDCMRTVFGDNYEEQMRNGTLDPGARDSEIRDCMLKQNGDGYLNDSGQWEQSEAGGFQHEGNEGVSRPDVRRDDQSGMNDETYRSWHDGKFDARRKEMEERMRAEIESQMRSGNFDRSKLPADFRPEGAFPPPESFNRPPEDAFHEQPSPEQRQDASQTELRSEPTSMISPLLANVLSALQYLLGVR